MTQDEFLRKWRHTLFGVLFEASTLSGNGAEFRMKRASLLDQLEKMLTEMYVDLNLPAGPVPAKLLADIKQVFATIKELEAKPLIIVPPAPM